MSSNARRLITRSLVPLLASLLFFAVPAAAQQARFTLRQAVEYALEHSPVLQAAQAEVQAREGAATTARSPIYPQVDLFAGFSQNRFPVGYPPATPPTDLRFDESLFQGGARLNYLLWDFRATRFELAAARERVKAALSTLDRRRQEVVFEVARTYLKALTFDDLIQAAEARRKSLQALVDRTHALVEGGRAVPADELKVRTQLARIDSDLALLRSGRRSALSALAAAMGLDGQLPELIASPAPAIAAPEQADEEQLRTAYSSRPDLAAAGHAVSAAENRARSAHKSRLPRFSVFASAVQYGAGDPETFVELIAKVLPGLQPPPLSLGNAVADWKVGAAVTFPLFDGGKRKGRIEQAEAERLKAEREARRLRLNIAREVRTARAELQGALSRVQALEQSVAQAREVLRTERVKYDAGKTTINFVLDAEADLLTNESLLAEARRSVSIASLALDLSLGRIGPGSLPGR